MERRQDIVLGAVFAALGLLAAARAATYSGATGIYPLALALAMAALGGLVAVRAVLRGRDDPRPLTEHVGRATIVLAIGAAYLALVPILGFYSSSALVVLVLPVALGFRQPVYLILLAGIFVAVVWVVFSVVLDKPLPEEFWQSF